MYSFEGMTASQLTNIQSDHLATMFFRLARLRLAILHGSQPPQCSARTCKQESNGFSKETLKGLE